MFWKKKKTTIKKTDISHETRDKRKAYRYEFNDSQRLQIQFKDKPIQILNISAGGVAFKNNGFAQLDFDFIKITLDIPNFNGDTTFYAGLRILNIDAEDICHCIFEECALEQHELIHKYVLEMQKRDLAH